MTPAVERAKPPTRHASSHAKSLPADSNHVAQTVYEVQSGEYLYRVAKAISKVGLDQYIAKHPPAPPIRLPRR